MFVVTGASSGIGQATAKALLHRGENVLAVARRPDGFSPLERCGTGKLVTVYADVSSDEGIEKIIEACKAYTLKGLIHSAGSLIPLKPYSQLNPEEITRDMAVHVSAPIALNNRFASKLHDVRIVFIDSYSARDLRVGWCAYSIVKAAAQMAAKAAQAELTTSHVIRVFPGGVRTPLVEAVLNATVESPTSSAFSAMDSAGDIAEPETIGGYIANILLMTNEEQLAARDYWDINNPDDHPF